MKVVQSYWILKDCIMKIKIHELAAQEFDEAIEWYELQSKDEYFLIKKPCIRY